MAGVGGGDIAVEWLARRLPDHTAHGIATEVGQLISHGELRPGQQFPPVRPLAEALGVSPATISAAWQRLRGRQMIAGRGRSGTYVADPAGTPRPIRYRHEGNYGRDLRFDLALAVPDSALLPDLPEVLRNLGTVDGLNDYGRSPILPALAEAARAQWPYPPDHLLVTNGGYEGLMLVLRTFIQPGDVVVVENPSTPRTLDLLDSVNARVAFVDTDVAGPDPDALAAELRGHVAAVILQAGVHNPTGRTVSRARRDRIATVLADSDVLVIEDDGIGPLTPVPVPTLAAVRRHRHVYVRSYSKSHGPDLRIAVLEGPGEVLARVQAYAEFGSAWTSRVLQQALARMLTDPQTQAGVRHAAETYERRRLALHAGLIDAGLRVPAGGGLQLWIPVVDERYALVTLASRGDAVSSGSRFCRPGDPPHVRVATARLDTRDVPEVAEAVAAAAVTPRAGRRWA